MGKNGCVMFILGAVVGSAVTYTYLNKKHKDVLYDDGSISYENKEPTQEEKDIYMNNYKSTLRNSGYSENKGGDDMKKPYVISPDEFGEIDNYEEISMTYYSDGVLADDNDNIVNDVEDIIGTESLTHFGEYEDDSVFVRNDCLKCDYEILLDSRKYSDVLKEMPYKNM